MINLAWKLLGIESPSRRARLKGEEIRRKVEGKCVELCGNDAIPMDEKTQLLAEYADTLTSHALEKMKPLHMSRL